MRRKDVELTVYEIRQGINELSNIGRDNIILLNTINPILMDGYSQPPTLLGFTSTRVQVEQRTSSQKLENLH
jgi:hypothetical protein